MVTNMRPEEEERWTVRMPKISFSVGFGRQRTSFVLSFRVDALLRQLTPQVREEKEAGKRMPNAVPYSSLFSGSSVSAKEPEA